MTWGATALGTTVTFTPGGSGRGQASEEGEEKKVMIGWRPRRRFAWKGDEQSF